MMCSPYLRCIFQHRNACRWSRSVIVSSRMGSVRTLSSLRDNFIITRTRDGLHTTDRRAMRTMQYAGQCCVVFVPSGNLCGVFADTRAEQTELSSSCLIRGHVCKSDTKEQIDHRTRTYPSWRQINQAFTRTAPMFTVRLLSFRCAQLVCIEDGRVGIV